MRAERSDRDPADGVAQQALMREVNERISLTNAEFGATEPDSIEMLCECVRERCADRITMTVADYEVVRRFPTRFFVKAGHEVADTAHVVSQTDGYVVVEAGGRGGVYAVASDPRRRTHRRRDAGA
jgi:hypothetical protein